MRPLQIKNHYGQYSKKELHKLVLELYNDNATLVGQLKNTVRLMDETLAKNIELSMELDNLSHRK